MCRPEGQPWPSYLRACDSCTTAPFYDTRKKYVISARKSYLPEYTAACAQQKPSWRTSANFVFPQSFEVRAEMTYFFLGAGEDELISSRCGSNGNGSHPVWRGGCNELRSHPSKTVGDTSAMRASAVLQLPPASFKPGRGVFVAIKIKQYVVFLLVVYIRP